MLYTLFRRHCSRGRRMTGRTLDLLLVGLFLWSGLCSSWTQVMGQVIGIDYGRLGNNLPTPQQSVTLLQQKNVGRVRIYDANADVLNALAGSGLEVSISVANDNNLITGLGTSAATADQWIADNVVAYPTTQITYIIVGNELFTGSTYTAIWNQILPAMNNLQTSLNARSLNTKVKITTSFGTDVLAPSSLPSEGTFRSDIATSYIQPILQFISSTQSSFFVNVYPYFAWRDNQPNISIDYALFATGSSQVTVTDGDLTYNNLLDAQTDAVIAAMEKVGFGDTGLTIGETGWPSAGDTGATIDNAQTYNNRLVQKPIGTPRRPGQAIPTYIFALFNENEKDPGIEQNWGLLNADGSLVYPFQL